MSSWISGSAEVDLTTYQRITGQQREPVSMSDTENTLGDIDFDPARTARTLAAPLDEENGHAVLTNTWRNDALDAQRERRERLRDAIMEGPSINANGGNTSGDTVDAEQPDTFSEPEPNDSSLVPLASPRRNIDDCIADLQRVKYTSLPRPNPPGADTAIFISPAPKEKNQSDAWYAEICAYYNQPFFVTSKNLLATGSEQFVNDLGPTAQYRIVRRRSSQIKQIQASWPHITKFIDLTPKIEGLDAVQMIMNLSCPLGVRLWGLALGRWGVARTLVSGQDEFTEDAAREHRNDSSIKTNPVSAFNQRDYKLPPEYSALRHRAAIQRVLLASEGMDPCLDSAPKVYSTAIVAQALGIMQSPLTDYVVRWLRAAPNSTFMEVLPEVTLKIAECLKCESLARDSFATLVGEGALEMQVERAGRLESYEHSRTIFHRRKEDLDEEWQNRVQYARLSFADRVRARFDNLVEGNMSWIEELREFQKFDRQWSGKLKPEMVEFKQGLKDFVRHLIYYLLLGDYNRMNERNILKNGGCEKLFPLTMIRETWEELQPHERIFTRSFWELMLDFPVWEIHQNDNSLLIMNDAGGRYGLRSSSLFFDSFKAAGIFRDISPIELAGLRRKAYMSQRIPPHSLGVSPSTLQVRNPSPPSGQTSSLNERESVTLTSRPHNVQAGMQTQQRTVFDNGNVLPLRPAPQQAYSTFTSNAVASQSINRGSSSSNTGRGSFRPGYESPMGFPVELSTQPSQHYFMSSEQNSNQADGVQDQIPLNASALVPFFDIYTFLNQAALHLTRTARSMLALPSDEEPTSIPAEYEPAELAVTNVLISVDEAETKYLPLWAGGLDDGSNGVFGSDIPLAENGFATAGPHFRGVNSTRGSSEAYSMIDGESSAPTSAFVHDGYADGLDRRRVYATSEVPSSDSESVNWEQVRAHKDINAADRSDAGDNTMHTGSDGWSDIPTPTGNENRQPNQADLALIEAALNAEKADGSRTRKSQEEDSYDDLFAGNNSDEETSFDDMLDEDDDDDFDMNNNIDDDSTFNFTEMPSYRGFDGVTDAAERGNAMDVDDDRGENYGASKGKGKEKDVVRGSMADEGKAYNPTYLYKKGVDEMDEDRP